MPIHDLYQQKSIVARPRMMPLFDSAQDKSYVVLSAGMGFGKSIAVSQYLSRTDCRNVWFTFTGPDNIPSRFWEHLVRVFSQHRPLLGEKMQALGFPENLQAFGLFLSDLTEELYQDNRMVAFVFDDVQLLENRVVKTFLYSFLSSRLENSYMVLCTREWPIFDQPSSAVPHMILAEDLRFTPDETADYLAACGLTMGDAVEREVHDYVSGWPIALSLVALSLKRKLPASIEPATFRSARPALHALFEQEVFSQYTPTEQDLLIKLSVLNSFP